MKKVFLFFLLLCTKVVMAQSFYLGGSLLGFLNYQVRQSPTYNNTSLPLDLNGQYVFKNNKFGAEVNVLSYLSGLADIVVWIPNMDYTFSGYFIYNALHKPASVLLQLKGGIFYTHYSPQFYDIGPGLGFCLALPISKKSYIGFDLTELIGLNNTSTAGMYDDNSISSQLSYTCYLIKFIHKI